MICLMQYKGKKKKIELVKHPMLLGKYIFGSGDTVKMIKEDADWFIKNDPQMFKFVGYGQEDNPVVYVEDNTKRILHFENDNNVAAPDTISSQDETPDLLDDESGQPAELTGDGVDGDGPMNSPEELSIEDTTQKNGVDLFRMKLTELVEHADSIGLIVDIDEALSGPAKRQEYIRKIKEKEAAEG